MRSWTRRAALAWAASTFATRALATQGAPRIVALDWTLASIVIELGVTPVGMAEKAGYADWVRAPAIPAGVAEVGLRMTPSLETLAVLKPDLILVNPMNARVQAKLETIARTFSNSIYTAERQPLARARAITLELGNRLGLSAKAQALLEQSENRIKAARVRIGEGWGRALLPVIFLDDRHAAFYGKGSLYADVLEALGLRSEIDVGASAWGQTTRGIEFLAECSPADVLVIGPIPSAARALLEGNGLWSSLLRAKGGRAFPLPPAWAYGDCGTAASFAESVADALTAARRLG